MTLLKLIFANFFLLLKHLPSLAFKANYKPTLEVLNISEINRNSSIIHLSISIKNVLFVKINNQYFYNPKTEISLTFVIPINENKELKIQGLGLLKRTKKFSYDLSDTMKLKIENSNPKIIFNNKLNIRLNPEIIKSQPIIKLNIDNIRLRSNTINIINQAISIDHNNLNVIKD